MLSEKGSAGLGNHGATETEQERSATYNNAYIVDASTHPFTTLERDRDDNIIPTVRGLLTVKRGSGAENTFANLKIIADTDPAFRRLVAYDRATGAMKHDTVYRSVDHLFERITTYLAEAYELETTQPKLDWLLNYIGFRNQFNSVVQAIESLPVPDADPLPGVMSMLKLQDPAAADHTEETLRLFLQKDALMKILPDATDGAITFPNDVCPVFQGPQGAGKTTLIRAFAVSDDMYLDAGAGDIDELTSRDGMLKLTGIDLFELGEYRHPSIIEKVKSLFSATSFTYRPPYGRGNVTVPRTASGMASTNKRHFLSDGTGNRRFFPVLIEGVDVEALAQSRDLFRGLRGYYWQWAKDFIASAQSEDELRRKLFTVRPSPELEAYLAESREDSRHVDITEDALDRYFDEVQDAATRYDWERFAETRKTRDSRREYYSTFEAALMIYPSGRVPKDFYHLFSEVAERRGLKQAKLRIDGKRVRAWVPNVETGAGAGTTKGKTDKKLVQDELLRVSTPAGTGTGTTPRGQLEARADELRKEIDDEGRTELLPEFEAILGEIAARERS